MTALDRNARTVITALVAVTLLSGGFVLGLNAGTVQAQANCQAVTQ